MVDYTEYKYLEELIMARLNLNAWGSDHKITFEIHKYAENDNLAIQMLCWDEEWAEPWSMLTVNLSKKCKPNCAFIDINNNGDAIIDWLISNNLGKPTDRLGFSGFCVYPEFEFDMDEVQKYVEAV